MSRSFTDSVRNALRRPVSGITVIVTVGNPLRADDGVGPWIGSRLKSGGTVRVVNAEDRPERCVELAARCNPTKVIVIDAADFKGVPGEIRVIPVEEMPEESMSTHRIPLRLVCELLRHETGAEVVLVGIQPGRTGFDEALSPDVKAAAEYLVVEIEADTLQ